MYQLNSSIGTLLGATAVILGAFGAHAFKKIMTESQLKNYETGVKYQMYHALLLLFIGSCAYHPILDYAALSIFIGTVMFSFSIYGLSLSASQGKKLKFLGPITPIGGLLLVMGWLLFFNYFLSNR